MSAPGRLTRRRALLAAAGAALLARPAAARADGDVPAALARLITLEQDAAFAYAAAGRRLFSRIGRQETDHALALRTHLGALGIRSPYPPKDASALQPPAARLAAARTPEAAIALERALLAGYRDAMRVLFEPATVRTAATAMASHAQHLAVLYERTGRDPIAAGR